MQPGMPPGMQAAMQAAMQAVPAAAAAAMAAFPAAMAVALPPPAAGFVAPPSYPVSLDWTEEEQRALEAGMQRYPPDRFDVVQVGAGCSRWI